MVSASRLKARVRDAPWSAPGIPDLELVRASPVHEACAKSSVSFLCDAPPVQDGFAKDEGAGGYQAAARPLEIA